MYSESPCTTAEGKTREPGERDEKWTGTHGCEEEEETYKSWVRKDHNSRTFRTTVKGGPQWHRVCRRISIADGVTVGDENVTQMSEKELHRDLPEVARELITILIWR